MGVVCYKDNFYYALDSGASDLPLSVGSVPMVRINGIMKRFNIEHCLKRMPSKSANVVLIIKQIHKHDGFPIAFF